MNSKYGCWQCGQPVCECERISKELDATPSPSNRAQRTAEIEWGRRAWFAQTGTPANSITAIRMAVTQLDAEARATGKSKEAVLAGWSAYRLDALRRVEAEHRFVPVALTPADVRRAESKAARVAARLARKAMPSNGMIKASRVLSLINVFIPCVFWIYPIPALLGVIFGFAGRRQLKRTQTVTATNDGIEIGIWGLAVSAAFWVFILLATIFGLADKG